MLPLWCKPGHCSDCFFVVIFQDALKLSPRAPSSPQISPRRLRAVQSLGADQSQSSSQEGPLLLPRLDARSSLPVISDDSGADRYRRRVFSLTVDKAARDLSPRREALGNGWLSGFSSKHELPEGVTEDDKVSQRLEGDDDVWKSDDDDDDDHGDEHDDDDTVKDRFTTQKKIHSLEEIKHTRYLRMKSPVHWLPKMGNVPKNLLSSSIIVGHTKVGFDSICQPREDNDEVEDEQYVCCEETEDSEIKEDVDEQCKIVEKDENSCESFKDNSELEENSTIGYN